MQKREQGDLAESLALSWLEHHDYALLERNYRRRVGELDLIVLHPDGHTVVFVEVRYRARQTHGGALASIDTRKRRKLIRTANAWLQQHADATTHARIDVIALCPANTDNRTSTRWQGHELAWVISAVEE